MEFETDRLLTEINETVNLKLMEFLKKQDNNGTQSIINKLPLVQKLREELEQKEEEKKLLYKENQRLTEEIKSLKEIIDETGKQSNGINLEIKEISLPPGDVNENEIAIEINKQEKLDDEFYGVSESSTDDLSDNDKSTSTSGWETPNKKEFDVVKLEKKETDVL